MRWFYKLSLRFRSLFLKSSVEQELAEELASTWESSPRSTL